jgi:hypothetical protein
MPFGIYHAFQNDLCDINSFIDFAATTTKKEERKALCSPTQNGKLFYRLTLSLVQPSIKAGEHFMKIVLLCI